MTSSGIILREEKLGLAIAIVAHVLIAVALMIQVRFEREWEPPQRINVTLATEVSLESTAPEPSPNPAAAIAPEISDEIVAQPIEERVIESTAPVRDTVSRRELTLPPKEQARPAEDPKDRSGLVGGDFLEGVSDTAGREGDAGERPSPRQQASINGRIIQQLRPHWNPPSGIEVERLVTVVRFRLNRDGSLRGNPEVLRTTGQTSANRNQVARHREQAVRAVRLAAPFNLPERFYSGWSTVTSNFNNELAQ